MILDGESAAKAAEHRTTNVPNTCQVVTREYYNAPSVGDFDGDGAADAEDGWKSEPPSARHFDRNPPRGRPVYYSGGRHDNGHRAESLGNGMIRTTDHKVINNVGQLGTVPLDWPEKTWGLTYVGWSDTIDGQPIPPSPVVGTPVPAKLTSRGKKIDEALKLLKASNKRTGVRADSINAAISALKMVPFIK